ncbi:MAG: hypothetical protein EOM20_02985 [Spartobacteria bacterium]|nr:hypothetical protein [Spartobacteria bacterium]
MPKFFRKWPIFALKTVKIAVFGLFLLDFCRFALLRARVLGMWLAARGRLKPEQRTGRLTPGQDIVSPGCDRGEIRWLSYPSGGYSEEARCTGFSLQRTASRACFVKKTPENGRFLLQMPKNLPKIRLF